MFDMFNLSTGAELPASKFHDLRSEGKVVGSRLSGMDFLGRAISDI